MNMIIRAAQLARKAHEGQKRKYTGRPYIEHPARVAGKIGVYINAYDEMVSAAYLHDVVEDTQVTLKDIEVATSSHVADLVKALTNPSKEHPQMARADRKAMDRDHLKNAHWEVKVIKMIDRIDNLLEMTEAPWDFKLLYAQESLALAEVVGDVDLYLKNDLVAIAGRLKAEAAKPLS